MKDKLSKVWISNLKGYFLDAKPSDVPNNEAPKDSCIEAWATRRECYAEKMADMRKQAPCPGHFHHILSV